MTGGHYEEHDYFSIGSGSLFARGAVKKMFDLRADRAEAVRVAVQALYDAADDDSATGGPDVFRGIYPIVAWVEADGYTRMADAELAVVVEQMLAGRRLRPDGPKAGSDNS